MCAATVSYKTVAGEELQAKACLVSWLRAEQLHVARSLSSKEEEERQVGAVRVSRAHASESFRNFRSLSREVGQPL